MGCNAALPHACAPSNHATHAASSALVRSVAPGKLPAHRQLEQAISTATAEQLHCQQCATVKSCRLRAAQVQGAPLASDEPGGSVSSGALHVISTMRLKAALLRRLWPLETPAWMSCLAIAWLRVQVTVAEYLALVLEH